MDTQTVQFLIIVIPGVSLLSWLAFRILKEIYKVSGIKGVLMTLLSLCLYLVMIPTILFSALLFMLCLSLFLFIGRKTLRFVMEKDKEYHSKNRIRK